MKHVFHNIYCCGSKTKNSIQQKQQILKIEPNIRDGSLMIWDDFKELSIEYIPYWPFMRTRTYFQMKIEKQMRKINDPTNITNSGMPKMKYLKNMNCSIK